MEKVVRLAIVGCVLACSNPSETLAFEQKRAPRAARDLPVTQVAAGSAVTPLGYGIKVNEGSSLQRTAYIVNDPDCPATLAEVAVTTHYQSERYSGSYEFASRGNVSFGKDVQGYTIVHMIFSLFGEHMKTLRELTVADLSANQPHKVDAQWYASEHDVREFLTSISYVREIRRADGTIWKADLDAVFNAVAKIIPDLRRESLDPEKPKPDPKLAQK